VIPGDAAIASIKENITVLPMKNLEAIRERIK